MPQFPEPGELNIPRHRQGGREDPTIPREGSCQAGMATGLTRALFSKEYHANTSGDTGQEDLLFCLYIFSGVYLFIYLFNYSLIQIKF